MLATVRLANFASGIIQMLVSLQVAGVCWDGICGPILSIRECLLEQSIFSRLYLSNNGPRWQQSLATSVRTMHFPFNLTESGR